ncbi:MAG: 4-(cytidine 5'-diphospho)-2-C-methyl-D-erythritol kinase [Candidatus Omnitrophica bacterium]|nr:4-(cytidine 5'-diphospho)-2-C-methyl-D-erythritol kinase [Candidatus Omnitrophota bacterium]
MLKIKAPAKINLFLEIGKRENSLHPLFSLVDIVSFYDYIYLKPSKKTEIKFISKWEIPKDNTVSKLIFILKKIFNFEVEVIVKKNIPPGTGLGGGSSDAGNLLLVLNETFNFGLRMDEMVNIAKEIGSDVPLFLYRKRCIIYNYGEKVIPCDDFKLYYLILIPNFSISTKDVYDKLDKIGEYGDLTDCDLKVRILIEEIKKGNIYMVEKKIFNRLENICFEIEKKVREVKDEVEKITNRKFFVSGSGGVLFSVFKEKEEVESIEKRISLDNWKKLVVESINFCM